MEDHARGLVRRGTKLLGRSHSPAAKQRWQDWYSSLSRRDRQLYRASAARFQKAFGVTTDLERRWSQLVRLLRAPAAAEDSALRLELEEVQRDLQHELFGGRPVAVDALEALSLLERDDASYPWDQALILQVVGRNLEAARAYLEAASRFDSEAAAGTGVTGDEADWAKTALAKAAACLVSGGQAAAAAALLPRLDRQDRAEIEPLVVAAAPA